MMLATAFVAIDFGGVAIVPPGTFAGVMLLVLALQVGLFLWLSSTGRRRRFWAGFEAAGHAVLFTYVAFHSRFQEAVAHWPLLVFGSYNRTMYGPPPDARHWDLMHLSIFDLDREQHVLRIVLAFEVSYAPVFLLIAWGGGLVASVGRGRDRYLRPSSNNFELSANPG